MMGGKEEIRDAVIETDADRVKCVCVFLCVCVPEWGMGRPVDQWVNPHLNWEDSGGRNLM